MDEKDFSELFGGNFSRYLATSTAKPKAPKDIKNIQDYASRLYFEDSVEREAKLNGLTHVIIYPNRDNPGGWLVYAYLRKKASVQRDSFTALLGGGDMGPAKIVGIYSTFEQADAWMEKNKYFGLKNTKFYEGIYASWDQK